MDPRVGYGAAVACVVVGATRFGHWVLKNPQPSTGMKWFIAAAVIAVATLVYSNLRSQRRA